MHKAIYVFMLSFILVNVVHAITLDEAIKTAIENSPNYLIQKENLNISKEEKFSKKMNNFGKISAFGSYNKYNSLRPLVPLAPPISPDVVTSKDILSAGIAYDVTLFNGFSDISSYKIAELSEANSKMKLNLSKEQLIFNVKSVYYKILAMENQLKAAKSYEKSLKNLYDNVENEVRLGKKAKIDLLKISSDYENALFNVKSIENSIDSLKANLASIIGVDQVDKVEPVKIDNIQIKSLSDLKHTYTYKISALELKKTEKSLTQAKSIYFPKIGFSAYYGSNYDLDGEGEELWQASINLNWLIFDFGNRESQVAKAKISKKKVLFNLKKTELELRSSIKEAKNKIKTAEEKVSSVKKQLTFLEKVKQAEKIKYEKGASNIYDLLYAYAKYQLAKTDYLNAEYDLEIQKEYFNYLIAGEK
jgi:outer membrane protein TolC